MMKIVIRETGERKTLSLIDPATGVDWVQDLIGNSGAIGDYIHYDDEADAYVMSQGDYEWWEEYIRLAQRDDDELRRLRRIYGDLADRIVASEWAGVSDYDDHHAADRRAIERLEALTPEEWRTTYTTDMGDDHEAIQIPWCQVRAILGRPHAGSAEDDWALVDALLDIGMPAWVHGAPGWVDEHGWGLVGPPVD